MKLVWPSREYLPSYVAALERGWSPDNVRGQVAAQEELARIASDPDAFLASLVDREATGGPITLPDGTTVPRLPGYRRWLWDGEFCGSIGLRWQRGTEALPSHCLGHIGYAVVPWKQRRGYATRALREVLREARAQGLGYVEIATTPANAASKRVIEACGGVLVEEFVTPAALGSRRELRYRVTLHDGAEHNALTALYDEPLRIDRKGAALPPKPVDVVVPAEVCGRRRYAKKILELRTRHANEFVCPKKIIDHAHTDSLRPVTVLGLPAGGIEPRSGSVVVDCRSADDQAQQQADAQDLCASEGEQRDPAPPP